MFYSYKNKTTTIIIPIQYNNLTVLLTNFVTDVVEMGRFRVANKIDIFIGKMAIGKTGVDNVRINHEQFVRLIL